MPTAGRLLGSTVLSIFSTPPALKPSPKICSNISPNAGTVYLCPQNSRLKTACRSATHGESFREVTSPPISPSRRTAQLRSPAAWSHTHCSINSSRFFGAKSSSFLPRYFSIHAHARGRACSGKGETRAIEVTKVGCQFERQAACYRIRKSRRAVMPTLTRAALLLAEDRRIPIERQYRIFMRHERLYRKNRTALFADGGQTLRHVVDFLPGRCDHGVIFDAVDRDRQVDLSPVIIPELVEIGTGSRPRPQTLDAQ